MQPVQHDFADKRDERSCGRFSIKVSTPDISDARVQRPASARPRMIQDCSTSRSNGDFVQTPPPGDFQAGSSQASNAVPLPPLNSSTSTEAKLQSLIASSCSGSDAVIGRDPRSRVEEDVDRLRSAFVGEAHTCIRALRRAMDDANVTQLASRFDEWRKVDINVTAKLQLHVEELIKQNQRLEDTYFRYLATDEFAKFNSAITDLKQSVDELTAARKAHDKMIEANIASVATTAAEEALARRASQMEEEVQLWRSYVEGQSGRWQQDDERWANLCNRLDGMQVCMTRLDKESATRHDILMQNEDLPQIVAQLLASTIRSAVDDSSGPTRQFLESLKKSISNDSQALRSQIESLFASTFGVATDNSGAVGSSGTVGGMLSDLHDGVQQIIPFKEQAGQWREEAVLWRDKADKASTQLADSLADLDAAAAKKAGLDNEIAGLEDQLQRAKADLRGARALAAKDAFKGIKEIENKGNVKVNRVTGELEIVKQVDFVACKTTEDPVAEFKQPQATAIVLDDLAKLVKMFGAPVIIEGHTAANKGGTPAYWETLAGNRAQLIGSCLESRAVDNTLISTKGLPGAKGRNRHCMVVRLEDASMFGPDTEQEKAGSRPASANRNSPRKASPRGKK